MAAADLEPVRRALLDRARGEAEDELSQADADAAAEIAAARAEASSLLQAARVQGEVDAAMAFAADLARARRQARAIVLSAQQEAYETFRRRSHDAVLRLRVDPAYPGLIDRLEAAVHRRLDSDVVISEHPGGGLRADAPGRHVELSLDVLADEAIDSLHAELDGLWSP